MCAGPLLPDEPREAFRDTDALLGARPTGNSIVCRGVLWTSPCVALPFKSASAPAVPDEAGHEAEQQLALHPVPCRTDEGPLVEEETPLGDETPTEGDRFRPR